MRFLKSLRLLSLLAIAVALTAGCSDTKPTGGGADTGAAQPAADDTADEAATQDQTSDTADTGAVQVAQVKFAVDGMT